MGQSFIYSLTDWLSPFLTGQGTGQTVGAGTGLLPLGDALAWHGGLLWLEIAPSITLALLGLALPFVLLLGYPATVPWPNLERRFQGALLALGLTGILVGLAQACHVLTIWYPAYGLQTALNCLALASALATGGLAWPLRYRFWPNALDVNNALALPAPTNQELLHHGRVQGHLSAIGLPGGSLGTAADPLLGNTVHDSETIRQRFESALHSAGITMFSQDRDLRYNWISGPTAMPAESYLGRTDFEVLNPSSSGPIVALKQKTIASGRPQEADVHYQVDTQHSMWYRLHVDPIYNGSGDICGVNCVAVDISIMKALEEEQLRLSAELAAALQRYQLAMQSSNVVVFTQDENLIYTSISKELLGRPPEEYIGQTDEAVMPLAAQNVLIPLKKRVLKSGVPEKMEVPITQEDKTHWFDLYVNPLKDVRGRTVGLTCAALNITERKGWEEHLRLLMRELTHRSKNLLAVIQAMARQTARHVDGVDKFVERFSARLQALGGAHDLLVRESWHGVNMPDLIASQLGHYADLAGTQVSMDGPEVFLAPEAAQNLGMALHEMATNAAKYGALSTTKGHVDIVWHWEEVDDPAVERRLHLDWKEIGGPPARKPERVGFGTHVIERNVTRSLNAKVQLNYSEDGFAAHMEIPAPSLSAKSSPIEKLTEPRRPRAEGATDAAAA